MKTKTLRNILTAVNVVILTGLAAAALLSLVANPTPMAAVALLVVVIVALTV